MAENVEDIMEFEDTQKGRVLTFSLDKESYGIDIKYVIEIIGMQSITNIPELPDYIKGVINLRGKVNIDGLLEKYKTVIINDEDRQIYEQAVQAWKEFMGHIDKAVEFSNIGKKDEVENIVLNECDESGKQLRAIFDTMLDNNILYAGEMTEENEATTQSSVNVMVFVIGFAIALSIVLGVYISRIIGIPVRQMVRLADAIALGNVDVKVEVDSKDEIGELAKSFRKMIENIRNQAYAAQKVAAGDLTIDVPVNSTEDLLGNNLSDMVRKNNEVLYGINAASEQVAIGSKQLSDSSIILSEGATEQASAIEELTASIEEISSQTELNAKNANQANELAEDVRRNAQDGNSQMQEMLRAMDEINEASNNISKVIKVIDDIAFQTNILALNAAVEAARAGQHGKGFAVVAEEVRNLAARSANAAKETTDMIAGSIKKSEIGTRIAKDTAQALDKIVTGIEQVASLVNGIANASSEQSVGIQQINQGIMQVSQVVQSNSATSEEIAAASEKLSSQAALLRQAVSQYKLKLYDSYSKYDTYAKNENQNLESIKIHDNMPAKANAVSSKMTDAAQRILLSDNEFGKY